MIILYIKHSRYKVGIYNADEPKPVNVHVFAVYNPSLNSIVSIEYGVTIQALSALTVEDFP